MFGNLRQGTPLYIFHRNEPKLQIGEVIAVSQPVPQVTTTYNAGFQIPGPRYLVDVKVKVGSDEINLQKLPANEPIADFGTGMVVSESRESIMTEIDNLRKSSQSILDSVEQHKHNIEVCSALLIELNPQAKQDAAHAEEMNNLKKELADVKSLLLELANKNKKKE